MSLKSCIDSTIIQLCNRHWTIVWQSRMSRSTTLLIWCLWHWKVFISEVTTGRMTAAPRCDSHWHMWYWMCQHLPWWANATVKCTEQFVQETLMWDSLYSAFPYKSKRLSNATTFLLLMISRISVQSYIAYKMRVSNPTKPNLISESNAKW